MKTVARDLGNNLWDRFLRETKREWFKVEVLQDYTPEDDSPSLRAWLAGNRKEALALLKGAAAHSEWAKELGKLSIQKTRLHVVEAPFTSYIEWELQCYKYINIAQAGESIFLVPENSVSHLSLPDGDFHIFDGERVIKNTYTPEGKCVSMDIYESGEDINYFLNLKGELLKFKEPLPEGTDGEL